MYQTEESGNYSVQVDLGNCQASGSIALVSELFDASINVSEMETMEEGESITVVVTENALNPDFEWYLNSTLIPSATGNTYEATQFGDYTVIINENSVCTGSREFNFTIAEPYDPFPNVEKIPNMISPNGDAINDTWVIPQKYVSGTNTEVIIMNNQGKVVFSTKDYLNDWPQQDLELTSINQVYYYVLTTQNNETKKGSITVIK